MTLQTANVCIDCEHLTESLVCEACGSAVVFPLSRWLAPIEREDVSERVTE